MPEKLEFDQDILDIRWVLNLAWTQYTQELLLNNYVSESQVINTVQNLVISGHDPVLIEKLSTEACRYVRGEVF